MTSTWSSAEELLPLPSELRAVAQGLQEGRPLGVEDVERLLAFEDVLALGALADRVARRRWRSVAHYARPRVVFLQPLCGQDCRVCQEELRGQGSPGGRARTPVDDGMREVHLVGLGGLGLGEAEGALREVRDSAPLAWVQGGTAPDLGAWSRHEGLPEEEVARRLHAAGLDGLVGGEEEVFTARGRQLLGSSEDPSFQQVLAWHAAAHAAGLTSVATFRYGPGLEPRELAERLAALRALQQRVAGFTVVAPVSEHEDGDLAVLARGPRSSLPGLEDLRCVAVARLALDNIAHVRVPWMALGLKMGPVALRFGGDDVGRHPLDAHVRTFAPPTAFMGLGESELLRVLESAGLVGYRVDGAYRPIPGHPEKTREGNA